MAVYDYLCETCGAFTETRPMAEFAAPQPCPGCGVPAPRALLTVPALATMDTGRRVAQATNERSANAPQRSHAAGCGCCGPKKTALSADAPRAAASGGRPWMIGH